MPANPIPRLSDEELASAMKGTPEWAEMSGAIQRTYQFKDFAVAMRFVNRVADAAESDQHHPDILVRWNKVTLSLSTHDAEGGGGISAKDFQLAAKTDAFFAEVLSAGGGPVAKASATAKKPKK